MDHSRIALAPDVRAGKPVIDAARAALIATAQDIGKTHRGVLSAFSDQLVKDSAIPKEIGRLLKRAETISLCGRLR